VGNLTSSSKASEFIEYAPEYSRKEKLRVIGAMSLGGLFLMAICRTWFFPFLKAFSATAECREVLGYSGVTALFMDCLSACLCSSLPS
jgi:hypothetical protein